MTTPENKSYKKNYAGAGINKNFLTPCRRIGLSRTKRTPKNICTVPQSNLPIITPETTKGNKNNEETNVTSVGKIDGKSTTDKEKKSESNGEECLKNTNLEKENSTVKSKINSQERNEAILEGNHFREYSKANASDLLKENNKSVDHKRTEPNESELEIVRTKGKKRKKLDFDTSSDSDSTKTSDKIKLDENEKKCGNTSGILLTKFTTEDYLKEYSANPGAFYDEGEQKDFDDFIVFSDKAKTKKHKSTLTKSSDRMKKISDELKAEKKLKQLSVSVEKLADIKSQSKSKCDSDEEDDMFMASPQTEQQKEDLLRLIAIKEAEIRVKEDKLEELKRARVYKTKHSPEKVAVHSAQWFNGCKRALTDLLVKMQEHGSMDMESLVKNLRIPSEIVEKLNIL